MYNIISQGGTTQAYVVEYVCDSLSDIDTLPTNTGVGSTCLVIENSSVWILGNNKIWYEL